MRGTVGGLHDDCLVAVSYSKLGAAARLRAWLGMLALTAGHPDKPWGAATVGRGERGRPQCATLTPIKPAIAASVLGQLVELYDKGLREPLPMPVKSAAEYAAHRVRGADVDDAEYRARMKWATGTFPARTTTPPTPRSGAGARRSRRCWRRPRPDETWGGEPHRFGELAVRLWSPCSTTNSGPCCERLRHLRPAAHRHHRAGGQRRHRQDPRHRCPGHPIRGRGRGRRWTSCCVVTFGRAASQELRERVRGHLVLAERALADPAAARAGDDGVHALLAEALRRRGREQA